ncbi:MAG: glycosyltransferase family 39 protein [Cyanobacteria bacterium J06607_13]
MASFFRVDFSQRRLWVWLMAMCVGVGIVFRVANLAEPVYWVDEISTSMRVSGYTRAEVRAQVATGEPISPAGLLEFVEIRRDRPVTDLVRVLSLSPEHTPLYFVLARGWAELFGSSVAAMRSLSVVFGLLGLPAMYGLARSLFGAQVKLAGWLAMGLLAMSPFFVAYGQEARPYSLWVLLLLLMGQELWRSLQADRWQAWVSYGVLLSLALYTSLLTGLVVVGQAVAVLLFHRRRWRGYGLATGGALLSLGPWIWVVVSNWQTLQDNTQWTTVPIPFYEIMGTWFYSLAVVFFDVPVGVRVWVLALQIAIALGVIAAIVWGGVVLVREVPRRVWGFVLAGALANPVLLMVLDVARNGQTTAPRYLIPAQLGALLVLAFWFGRVIGKSGLAGRVGRGVMGVLLLLSVVSGFILQPSPYLKSRNLSNAEIVELLNKAEAPQVVSTPRHIQDLMSLSYGLRADTRFYVLPEEVSPVGVLSELLEGGEDVFLFAPSAERVERVSTEIERRVRLVYEPPPLIAGGFPLTVWRVEEGGNR